MSHFKAIATMGLPLLMGASAILPTYAQTTDSESVEIATEASARGRINGVLNRGVEQVDWALSSRAQFFQPLAEQQQIVLTTNTYRSHQEGETVPSRVVGIIGTDTSRYLALGENPMIALNEGGRLNEGALRWFQNGIQWLANKRGTRNAPINATVAQFEPTDSRLQDWLSQTYGDRIQVNSVDSCDNQALQSCLAEPTDVLIISDYASSRASVRNAMTAVRDARARGIAVLYLASSDNRLGNAILNELNLARAGNNEEALNELVGWQRSELNNYGLPHTGQPVPAEPEAQNPQPIAVPETPTVRAPTVDDIVEYGIEAAIDRGNYLAADLNPNAGAEGASVRARDALAAELQSITAADHQPRADIVQHLMQGVESITWHPDNARMVKPLMHGQQQPVLTITRSDERPVLLEYGYQQFQNGRAVTERYEAVAHFAIASEQGGRHIVVGASPLKTLPFETNEDLAQWLENTVTWLADKPGTRRNPITAVMANVSSNYQRDAFEWLSQRFGTRIQLNNGGEFNDCRSTAQLNNCLANRPDVLIMSGSTRGISGFDLQGHIDLIREARAAGTTVLLLQDGRSPLSDALLDEFIMEVESIAPRAGSGRNAFDTDPRLVNWTSADLNAHQAPLVKTLNRLVTGYPNDLFNLDDCEAQNTQRITLSNGNEESLAAMCRRDLSLQLIEPMNEFRRQLRLLSEQNLRLFNEHSDRFWQLALLWADAVRSQVVYGESIIRREAETKKIYQFLYPNRAAYLGAIIADSMIYANRDHQPAAPDIGNFSRSRHEFTVAPSNLSKRFPVINGFTSTGVYIFPGETVTVQRNDASDQPIQFFTSSVRAGSTDQYTAYRRPKYLQMIAQTLNAGESFTFSSPFGGPLYLSAEVAGEVDLTFTNVGQHPTIRLDGTMTSAERVRFGEEFIAAVGRNEFDWVDIAMPSYEAHSRMDLMPKSLEAMHRNGDYLYKATKEYFLDKIYLAAGMSILGMPEDEEVHGWLNEKGWPITYVEETRHSNHDQSSCGSACSGNPTDMSGAFVPPLQGTGIIHEYGHKLIEKNFIVFKGMNGHGQVNSYGEYMRGWLNEDDGVREWSLENLGYNLPWYVNPPTEDQAANGRTVGDRASFQCPARPWEHFYNSVLASVTTGVPAHYLKARELERRNQGKNPPVDSDVTQLIYWQMLVIAQDHGVVKNPYAIQGRLQGYSRQLKLALQNASNYAAYQEELGLTRYRLDEARAMSGLPSITGGGAAGEESRSERLVIALSMVTGYNYWPWIERLSIVPTFRDGEADNVRLQLQALENAGTLKPLALPDGVYIPETPDGYCSLTMPRVVPLRGGPVERPDGNPGDVPRNADARLLFDVVYDRHRDSKAGGYTFGYINGEAEDNLAEH